MGLFGPKVYKTKTKSGEYYLHVINTPRYYFSKKVNSAAAVEKLPEGFKVIKNTQSGLPFLVRA